MLGRLSAITERGSGGQSSRLLKELKVGLPKRLQTFVSEKDPEAIALLVKEFTDISGYTDQSINLSSLTPFLSAAKDDSRVFETLLGSTNYGSRLAPLISLSDIIGSGFDDVSEATKESWLISTGAFFPLSIFISYANLAGELPVESGLSPDTAEVARRLLPPLLFALSKNQLREVKSGNADHDKERVNRLDEGLRSASPAFRELAASRTGKGINLTVIKNLYSRTYGEVYATSIVTVPSASAPSMTYGVEKRAQLLFVLEYCARNLGNMMHVLEEYEVLSGTSPLSNKPIIPNPSVFLSILRREMSRLKDLEKALNEAEQKTYNQAFIYYTEAGRTLSRLPLKTGPRMQRFLKDLKHQMSQYHTEFSAGEIPSSLREELVQFLTITK